MQGYKKLTLNGFIGEIGRIEWSLCTPYGVQPVVGRWKPKIFTDLTSVLRKAQKSVQVSLIGIYSIVGPIVVQRFRWCLAGLPLCGEHRLDIISSCPLLAACKSSLGGSPSVTGGNRIRQ